jgi:hypothetical protein
MYADQLSFDITVQPRQDKPAIILELQHDGDFVRQTVVIGDKRIPIAPHKKGSEWERILTPPVWITAADGLYTFDVVKWVDNS